MICRRCQKSLRNSDGVKCAKCNSGFHIQCVGGRTNMELESGDKISQWTCATCRIPTDTKLALTEDAQALLKSINAITEKFELVNKIQLPKLNNDLLQVKCVMDRIGKQNEEILSKIDEMNSKKREENVSVFSPACNYRRRNLNLTDRMKSYEEQAPILGAEKLARYRTRRRSYPLMKMLLQLNRRLRRNRTPRR